MVDNLYMTYGGNRLTSVRDNATQLTYEGATDFNGEPKKEYPLTYNDAGSLVSDAGRKIAKIDYDNLNNPVRIQFTDGNVTKYIYSATGEKLRVIYQTAVPNIAVAIDSTKELAPSEIQCTDYTDYLLDGNLTLKNGHIDKYQFDEGYCQAEKNISDANKDDFTFCYYDQDHLGNIRQVTKADGSQTGNIVQTINYYPFGMQFCDGTTCYFDQKHKYNGKEFDNMYGLNTYDYGARQYNPVTARWDRMDPLCEKYYNVSPYVYCANNPINTIDENGDSLTLESTCQSYISSFIKIEENAMGGWYEIKQDKSGKYILVFTNKKGVMNTEQQTNYEILNDIINSSKNISFTLVNNSENVAVGDNGTSEISSNPGKHVIDIGDIEHVGTSGILKSQGLIGHELYEGYLIQALQENPVKAHFKAIQKECKCDGVIICPSTGSNIDNRGFNINVIKNNIPRTIVILLKHNNVIGVQNN